MRLIVGLLVLLWPAIAGAEPLVLRSAEVPLNRDNLVQMQLGPLRYLGGLHLTSEDPEFGGLSGLALAPDGSGFTAVTDRGRWFTGRLVRDAQGVLTGVRDTALTPMLDRDGKPVAVRSQTHDAEALARDGDGLIVGFERRHRLWRYAGSNPVAAIPQPLPAPPGLSRAPINGGVEALAVLGPGRYLAVAEELETEEGDLRGWLFEGGAWRELAYARQAGWKPTDFTVLPGGDVLALERHFSRLGGFTSQIRRIPAASIAAGALLQGTVLAEFVPPVLTDNFEGLSAFRGADGQTYLLVVSDNNFHPLQRTLMLLFRLDE